MTTSPALEAKTAYKKKLFYRIADVAEIAGVEPHVLRYWETRFPTLRPQRVSNDERRYRQKDVDLVLNIRGLLYDEKFTIEGAVKQLSSRRKATPKTPVETPSEIAPLLTPFNKLKGELSAIREELQKLAGL